ncbi:efflux RND transporter periplasmic adaptor subunit [Pseudomonadota bacterium]
MGFRQYQQANKTPDYELASAKLKSITEIVSETGNVTITGAIPMYSTTNGLIEEVFVKNGDVVKKGDDLFKVTATATKQEKDTALSNYLTAKTAWETSKATELSLQATMFSQWDTFKELAEGDDYENEDGTPKHEQRNLPEFHIPEKEWLAAEASYKKQALAVNQAAVNMSATWQAYQATQDSQVISVIDGEIRNLAITVGDQVTVPTALTKNSTSIPLIIFNPHARTIVKVDIGETDAIKVKSGQEATIEFDAIPHKSYSGRVDRVDTLATPTDGVVKYSVYLYLQDQVTNIKGGMTADVDIIVATKENVLTVPTSSVKPHEGGRAVRVVDNKGEIEFIPVETGSRGNGDIEIASGIEEGTQVIVALKNEQVKRSGSLF